MFTRPVLLPEVLVGEFADPGDRLGRLLAARGHDQPITLAGGQPEQAEHTARVGLLVAQPDGHVGGQPGERPGQQRGRPGVQADVVGQLDLGLLARTNGLLRGRLRAACSGTR